MSIIMEGQVLPLSYFFASVRHLVEWQVYVLEEDGVANEEGLVYKKKEGQELTKWTST